MSPSVPKNLACRSFDFLSSFTPRMYTGQQVARDSGSPLVWTGSALLMLGLMGMMYVRERKVWGFFAAKRRPGAR